MGFCQWIHYSGKLMQCEVSPPYAKQTNPWLTGELLAQVHNTNDTLITDFLLYVRELETFIFFLFKDSIYLFLEGKEGEREGEKHQCVGASCMLPHWGPGPQLRHVPCLGVKPATLWFSGRCLIHQATPARAEIFIFLMEQIFLFWHYTFLKCLCDLIELIL